MEINVEFPQESKTKKVQIIQVYYSRVYTCKDASQDIMQKIDIIVYHGAVSSHEVSPDTHAWIQTIWYIKSTIRVQS